MEQQDKYQAAISYIRAKVNQLLSLMGTLPLRAEELDDDTLLELDPIGIIGGSFGQVMAHLNDTNRKLSLATNEIRAILDAIQAAVVVIDGTGRVDECNRLALEWFFDCAEPGQVLGRPLPEVCSCGEDIAASLTDGLERDREIVLKGRHFQAVASTIADETGRPGKTVLLFFDITRLKGAEAGLRLYAQVFDNLGEGIMISDVDNRILEVNEAFCRITGYAEAELLGGNPDMLQSGLQDANFHAQMWREVREKGHWKGEIIDRAKNGRIIPLLQSISQVRDGEGRLTHYISVITDISSLKETQTRLDFLAHHDVLTELPNRLLFSDRLGQAIKRAQRDRSKFALLFIDLDRFKNINDSLGHHIGDQCLIEIAQRLRSLVRRSDTVARVGGDEFVVQMENIGSHVDATRLADKIVANFKQPCLVADTELHIGCSIGITLYPEDGTDAISLLRNADAAMYRAKEKGRDGHARFSHELSEAAGEKLALENALRVAVRENRFLLHYQPIVDPRPNRIVAVEALIRWPGAAGASPERFIPLAEETRLIIPLGLWVLGEAIRQMVQWLRQGMELDYISVNISAVQAAHPDFPDLLLDLLREHGLPGSKLQIELTENALMQDIELCRKMLTRLRDHGVRTSIDDFGTGYSSLAYLRQLPLDNLKIDRSFVQDIPGDANDCAIAEAVISLAHILGLETIAEGVETEDQEHYLMRAGCDKMQGYRYARALPAEELVRRYGPTAQAIRQG